jgi:hypothetical protein
MAAVVNPLLRRIEGADGVVVLPGRGGSRPGGGAEAGGAEQRLGQQEEHLIALILHQLHLLLTLPLLPPVLTGQDQGDHILVLDEEVAVGLVRRG